MENRSAPDQSPPETSKTAEILPFRRPAARDQPAPRPALTGRGKAYLAVGIICLVLTVLWIVQGIASPAAAGNVSGVLKALIDMLPIIGLLGLLGWVLVASGLKSRQGD